jgi:hypothetical protein
MIKLSNILKEEQPHQKEMVDGIVEMLRQVEDIENRKTMALDRLADFKKEGIVVDAKEFLQRCGLDSINEKWSAAYKRSINCSNPKGFSQRAHCQGRKKKELVEDINYGYKHILHLIPTGYSPNNPKYKKDLLDLRDLLNKFYDTHGYDVRIRNTF